MKKPGKWKISSDKLAVTVCTAVQILIAAGLMELYNLTKWYILLLLGLLAAVPALSQLALMLPFGRKQPAAEPAEPPEEDQQTQELPKKKRRFFAGLKALGKKMGTWYEKGRDALVIVLIAGIAVAGHILFWKIKPEKIDLLNFVVPVVLAVLFVIHIAMELWCKSAGAKASDYNAAQLKGLRGNFMLMRVAYILAIVTSVLRLLGLYDATAILKVLLGILFVYETVFLLFTLAVRAIRKEMRTQPEVLVSLIGAGSNTDILGYLEENTGITMRSLWSLHLVKHVLPVAILGVAVLLWLSTGFVQIEPNQQGALFRLGKLQDTPLEPGLHLTLPWPVDRVDVYDTQSIQKVNIGYIPSENMDNLWTKAHGGEEYRLLLGNGEEVASVNLLIEYRIGDLMQYIKSSSSPESILQAHAYKIVTSRTISTNLDTLLSTDREVFAESFQQELIQSMENDATGLEVVNVVLESIHPPVEIATAYQDIISAGIDAEYLILLAQTTANRNIMDAKDGATKAISEATVRQYESVAAAQASVTEFMASVEADKSYADGYRYQKYIQALTQAYSNAKIIIVGQGVDAGSIYIGSLPVQSGTNVPDDTTQEGT